ncbi:MAG TPA: GNAT family N-acetyltransferase [Acidimicrobiales bacterium]|nr:GNAT family N-acetyltransferase [Acidimicrobiales bacterium]
MATDADLAIDLLEGAANRDAALVGELTGLINDVYAIAERGLWRDGATRTTTTELAEVIAAGQIAVATQEGHIVGSVHVHQVADDVGGFGMLVAAPDHRGSGIGRALVEFAEQHSREHGLHAMRLELLVPRGWRHPTKEFLTSWYGRIGYRLVRTGTIDDAHPHLGPLLATPCDLQVHEKPLDAHDSDAAGRRR